MPWIGGRVTYHVIYYNKTSFSICAADCFLLYFSYLQLEKMLDNEFMTFHKNFFIATTYNIKPPRRWKEKKGFKAITSQLWKSHLENKGKKLCSFILKKSKYSRSGFIIQKRRVKKQLITMMSWFNYVDWSNILHE